MWIPLQFRRRRIHYGLAAMFITSPRRIASRDDATSARPS
jgi:hypothetical protein